MIKFLIPIAAAGSALAFAAPASAQWYPQPVRPMAPYAAPYAYGHVNYGHARALQARIDHIQREIRRLAQYRMISPHEYRTLRNQSRQIERSLRRNARDGYGLNPREAYAIERRIARLEYRLARDVRDGRRYAYGWRW